MITSLKNGVTVIPDNPIHGGILSMSKSETAGSTPAPDVNWQILDNVKLFIVWQNIDTRSTERLTIKCSFVDGIRTLEIS